MKVQWVDNYDKTTDIYKIGIYQITCLVESKRVYIGSTYNSFYQRWSTHYTQLKSNSHVNKFLQRYVNKYGINNVWFSVLEYVEEKDITNKENYWIQHLEKTGISVMNFKKAKSNKGHKYSDEFREKCRLRMLTWYETNENPQKGKFGGENNNAKLVLNLETGICYDSCKEACATTHYNYRYFMNMLNGYNKNRTSFIKI